MMSGGTIVFLLCVALFAYVVFMWDDPAIRRLKEGDDEPHSPNCRSVTMKLHPFDRMQNLVSRTRIIGGEAVVAEPCPTCDGAIPGCPECAERGAALRPATDPRNLADIGAALRHDIDCGYFDDVNPAARETVKKAAQAIDDAIAALSPEAEEPSTGDPR